MSQTPENQPNSSPDVIRKIYVRDIKAGSTVHTVFRVADKERHTARSGKVFLSMTLFDKSGRLDGRIFDNVDAAQAAFENDDYLLVAGKVALFHGQPQLVVERLEKLDPGPIDAKEFVAPPAKEKPEKSDATAKGSKGSKRLAALLEDPAISSGLEALLKHLERYIDERVEQRLSGGSAETKRSRPPRHEGPRHEGPRDDKAAVEKKPEPARAGLPKDLAFKPFNALAPKELSEAPEGTGQPPGPASGS